MKKFVFIFLFGLVGFFVVNIVSDICRSDSFDDPDAVMRYGFPFLYQTEGNYPDCYYSCIALLADILTAGIWSALIAEYLTSERRLFLDLPPNTSLEPTPITPAVGGHTQIHACSFSRRGSVLGR